MNLVWEWEPRWARSQPRQCLSWGIRLKDWPMVTLSLHRQINQQPLSREKLANKVWTIRSYTSRTTTAIVMSSQHTTKSWRGNSTPHSLRPTTKSMASRCRARPLQRMGVPAATPPQMTTQTRLHCLKRETSATFKSSARSVALSPASTSATIWSYSSCSSTNVWKRQNSRTQDCWAAQWCTVAQQVHFITKEVKAVWNARGKTSQTSPFNNSKCRCSSSRTVVSCSWSSGSTGV